MTPSANDGKGLEALVAFVEETLVPKGLNVQTNRRVFDEEGRQVAEFDVEVRGKVSTTSFAWLIQCRDRPSSGPAPGEWIEQLAARRARFGFDRVTAVSTTGFAAPAKTYAAQVGIELREVRSLTADQFGWLAIPSMKVRITERALVQTHFVLDYKVDPQALSAAQDMILASDPPFGGLLRSTTTGEKVTPQKAFAAVHVPELAEILRPEDPPRLIRIKADYPNDNDHFVIDTDYGPVRVRQIVFTGQVCLKESDAPFMLSQYSRTENGEVISEVAAANVAVENQRFSLEIHKIAEAEFMQVVMRPLGPVQNG